MPLPTLQKTWIGTYNNQIVAQANILLTNQTALLAIKNAILAMASNPATVVYSCNSVTAGAAGDGVDRWVTQANLVWNSAGSAHSWIVLKQAGVASNFQILISCEGASANGVLLTVVTSQSAGFTGGTATARPTATDEVVALSNASWGATNTLVSLRYTVQQSDDGQCTRIWIATAAAATAWAGWEKPKDPTTGWTNPVGAYWQTSLVLSTLCAPGQQILKIRIGTTNGFAFCQCEGNTSGLGPADTTYGNAPNQVDGTWPLWPIAFASITSGIAGRHGAFFDLWFGSSARVSADRYPSATPGPAGQFAQFGSLVTPWNQGPVNLT